MASLLVPSRDEEERRMRRFKSAASQARTGTSFSKNPGSKRGAKAEAQKKAEEEEERAAEERRLKEEERAKAEADRRRMHITVERLQAIQAHGLAKRGAGKGGDLAGAVVQEVGSEEERRRREIDRDLAAIMKKHGVANKEDTGGGGEGREAAPTSPGRAGVLGGLSGVLEQSYAASASKAPGQSPLSQRLTLRNATLAEMQHVEEALSSLKAQLAQAGPHTPPKGLREAIPGSSHRPPPELSALTLSPRTPGRGPAPSQRGQRAFYSKQAISRLDINKVLSDPSTRGLLPLLPTSVVQRAVYRVNTIYGAHIPEKERGNMAKEVSPVVQEALLQHQRPRTPIPESGVPAPATWHPSRPSCLPDFVDGELGPEPDSVVVWDLSATIQSSSYTSPRAWDRTTPRFDNSFGPKPMLDSTERVLLPLSPRKRVQYDRADA